MNILQKILYGSCLVRAVPITRITSVAFQPLEVIKNRMQLSDINRRSKRQQPITDVVDQIIINEGFLALYRGGSALMLKTVLFTTPHHLTTHHLLNDDQKQLPTIDFIFHQYIRGFIVAFFETPAEVALVRMSVDGGLPLDQQRNYRNVFHAMRRIYYEEGILTLWRGATPSMGITGLNSAVRVTNSAYLNMNYDKLLANVIEDKFLLKVLGVGIPGLFSTVVSLPIDMAKTRLQNMGTIDGTPEYSGVGDVLYNIIRKEGLTALWKGFIPYYARVFPYTLLTYGVNRMCS